MEKSRLVDKFMELNQLYFFDAEKVAKNKKPVDPIAPFEFMVDLT